MCADLIIFDPHISEAQTCNLSQIAGPSDQTVWSKPTLVAAWSRIGLIDESGGFLLCACDMETGCIRRWSAFVIFFQDRHNSTSEKFLIGRVKLILSYSISILARFSLGTGWGSTPRISSYPPRLTVKAKQFGRMAWISDFDVSNGHFPRL